MGGQGIPVALTGQNLCVDGGYTGSILGLLPGLPKAQQQSRPAET